jgi:hypothetical protein
MASPTNRGNGTFVALVAGRRQFTAEQTDEAGVSDLSECQGADYPDADSCALWEDSPAALGELGQSKPCRACAQPATGTDSDSLLCLLDCDLPMTPEAIEVIARITGQRGRTCAADARQEQAEMSEGRCNGPTRRAYELEKLARRAVVFVNTVALTADDKTASLEWLADASQIVGTPDPDYSCGATCCDDAACSTHSPTHWSRSED